jgi:hypothetical protein
MPLGIGIWEILLLALIVLIFSIPAYLIATRSGIADAGLAFIPFVGPFIVLLRVCRQSAWWALLFLLPYLGILVLIVWVSIAVPPANGRSQWWTLALLVPGVSTVAWWVYALTVEEPRPVTPVAEPQ